MNPFIPLLSDELWERHQERLTRAEQWRQAKRGASGFSREDRLRLRLGDQLIALGHYLKATTRPAPHLD